ncbi:MAG TPA: SDR family oxidoreductase [Methylophilus sp.]|nr:SDR family oxidoreductase [Methylophilus sp.]HQQ33342.1 SDR family oxidoreductase [Methylophilus sp.]
MKVLVLGASGMLGNAVMRVMSESSALEVFGSVRASAVPAVYTGNLAKHIITNCDVEDSDTLVRLFSRLKPDVVINCIGLIKQLAQVDDPLITLPINAMLPHRLAHLCALTGARLIHMSTDCVFSGAKGNYTEQDISDAEDLYGKSKFIGEVDYPHSITLRTSIIGHELNSTHGLIEWFLAQQGSCRGYRRVIFSGLPTVVLAQVIRDVVIPKPELFGVYHVAAQPISKFDLLKLVAEVYGKTIDIVPDDVLVIDRSLNAQRFFVATGYKVPTWRDLIKTMYSYQ